MTTIYSFRRVLQHKWVLHGFDWGDRWVAFPWPVPVAALVYFVVLEVLFWVLWRVGFPLAHVGPFWLWWLPPVWVAVASTKASFEGRRPDRWVWQAAVFWACRPPARRPVRIAGGVRVRFDVSARALHRGRVVGPSVVRFRDPVRFALRPRGFTVRPGGAERVHELGAGERLEVRP